jgi:hypothetical protein
MKMQPLFFIAVLILLLSMIVLESDAMRSQPQRVATVKTH